MQIKVTDTRMQRTVESAFIHIDRDKAKDDEVKYKDTPLALAKLVLIPTDEFTVLTRRHKTGELLYSPEGFACHGVNTNLKPYFISETEKIEVGDVWMNLLTNTIHTASEYDVKIIGTHADFLKNCKKILAFPEHISDKHYQAIGSGKIVDYVLIECEQWAMVKSDTKWIYKGEKFKVDGVYMETYHLTPEYGRALNIDLTGTRFEKEKGYKKTVIHEHDLILEYVIKLNSHSHITLRKYVIEKHEEIWKWIMEYRKFAGDGVSKPTIDDTKQWFEENVK